MAPHCDTMDGPVVIACKKAIKMANVNYVLPFVPKTAEEELRISFNKTLRARELGEDAADVADLWFFETAVRLHREGEGASYAGLKPAGLDWAEKNIKNENPTETIEFLKSVLDEEMRKKFDKAMSLKNYDVDDVDAAREYTEAMLHFVLFSHHTYKNINSSEEH